MGVVGLTDRDMRQLERQGITREQAEYQIGLLRSGVECPKLVRPCALGDGILLLKDEEAEEYRGKYERVAASAKVAKFVPASGAATRMVRPISWVAEVPGSPKREELEVMARQRQGEQEEFLQFARGLPRLACFADLKRVMDREGLDAEGLYQAGELKPLIEYLLGERGLGYAKLPKALVKFHCYGVETRTALEEHLWDAAAYARDGNGCCRLHFTLSPQHKGLVDSLVDRVKATCEKRCAVRFEIQTSVQDPSTDTLALDERGELFRHPDGSLLLRPGGHGALIGNLERTAAEVVFINNIDDVMHESARTLAQRYQMALGGFLFELRRRIFFLLERLVGGDVTRAVIEEAARVVERELSRRLPEGFDRWEARRQVAALRELLDRPLRVCGVVANRGEPGGGPFWVAGPAGTETLQIVEGAQVDRRSQEQMAIFRSASHFNPVHIVATLTNHAGKRFSLASFGDPAQAFVAEKSEGGRKLTALEWPGLWNGAMALWNTLFIEIPRQTFAPVKTICDLLKPAHQGG